MKLGVSFKAVLTGKSLTHDPVEGECVKLEFAEYKPIPPPIITTSGGGSEVVREVAPIIQQVIRSMPFTHKGRVKTPRLILWLTRREWDELEPKPELGNEVTITVKGKELSVEVG